MSVKIFLPIEYFYVKHNCDIYGEIKINDNNAITYYIVTGHANDVASEPLGCQQLRHLGHIIPAGPSASEQHQRDVSLSFAYDHNTPNIYLNKLSIKPSEATHVNIYLYERHRVLQLHMIETGAKQSTKIGDCANIEQNSNDDFIMLYQLLDNFNNSNIRATNKQNDTIVTRQLMNIGRLLSIAINFPIEVLLRLFISLMESSPLEYLLRHTMLYKHHLEWKKIYQTGMRSKNFLLDRILGICVMLLLLLCIPHPGDYLIQYSHFIISKLRILLHALKGSPIGLKLNVHLNNFFLDCFNYHIDLWATFLVVIEPFVRQLFIPIGTLGALGLSYQLALLADLISVVGLHAHCFYIYTAVLYKVEIKALQVLWKVVLGKRRNALKNRIESHNYMNRQLYLATIFFATLLFLFPTILVYYVVFATLRFGIFLANLTLQLLRRRILEFPLQLLIKYCTGHFYELSSLQLQQLSHKPSPLLHRESEQLRMIVFKLNVLSSSLARIFSAEDSILKKLTAYKQTRISDIFERILKGTF